MTRLWSGIRSSQLRIKGIWRQTMIWPLQCNSLWIQLKARTWTRWQKNSEKFISRWCVPFHNNSLLFWLTLMKEAINQLVASMHYKQSSLDEVYTVANVIQTSLRIIITASTDLRPIFSGFWTTSGESSYYKCSTCRWATTPSRIDSKRNTDCPCPSGWSDNRSSKSTIFRWRNFNEFGEDTGSWDLETILFSDLDLLFVYYVYPDDPKSGYGSDFHLWYVHLCPSPYCWAWNLTYPISSPSTLVVGRWYAWMEFIDTYTILRKPWAELVHASSATMAGFGYFSYRHHRLASPDNSDQDWRFETAIWEDDRETF